MLRTVVDEVVHCKVDEVVRHGDELKTVSLVARENVENGERTHVRIAISIMLVPL